MTITAWLHERTPVPPPRLMARIETAVGPRGNESSTHAPEVCIDAAEELLRDLLSRPTAGRESALDLLTVDALVTYAFEAAAADPESLGDTADRAMTCFAALA